MPLFMDIHTVDSDNFTVEDVVKAHMQDLAIQENFGVTQIKYWVNVEAKTLFCLMEGPDKEACNEVHKQSHGNTACNIIEVADDEFNLFLGEGESVNDLAHTVSGEIDTGYRTILMLRLADFTCHYAHFLHEIQRLIKNHNGGLLLQPEDDLLATFVLASDAMLCGSEIYRLIKTASDNTEFTLTVMSGRPVDEKGDNLFEDTKKKMECVCALGAKNTMYLDSAAIKISDKEFNSSRPRLDNFFIIQNEDSEFLFHLYDILNQMLPDPDFKSGKIHRLLALSKSQAYRKIKFLTGLAPNQLIQEFRLRRSLKALGNNRQTISEAAFALGYNSPPYFSKVFKNRFGISPSGFIRV